MTKGTKMTTKHTTESGITYSIKTYTVGQSFGTAAEVRRGGFVARTEVFPRGNTASAIEAGKRLAEKHAAR